MLFRILHDDNSGVLSYLLGDEVTGEAALIDPRSSDRVVLDAMLHAEHLRLRWIYTPGHTRGGLSFRWRDRVFCGGLLATQACPLQPQPEDAAALWDSVRYRLFSLPGETLLFAGHARHSRVVSTVLEQRRWHPQFAALSRDAYLARMAAKVRGVDSPGNGRSVASAR